MAKANAANLVAQLQVETADKQQLSTNLADLGIIKTELEAKLPSGCSNFISNWNHKLFDHSFSVLTFHEGWSLLSCSVATQSTSNSSCYKASWYRLCIEVVNCGACTAPLARQTERELLCSPSMTYTLGTSVGSSMLHLVLCCWRSWGCHLCRFFGGGGLLNFGTGWLLVLLGRFSTQSCLTTLMMLFLSGVVPGTFLAP